MIQLLCKIIATTSLVDIVAYTGRRLHSLSFLLASTTKLLVVSSSLTHHGLEKETQQLCPGTSFCLPVLLSLWSDSQLLPVCALSHIGLY